MGKKQLPKLRDALIFFAALVFGVLVIAGVTDSLGSGDEAIPMTDSWLAKGSEIDVKAIDGQVMFQRRGKVDKAGQTVEDIGHELRRVEGLPSGLKVAAVPTGEVVKESYLLTTLEDFNGRAVRTTGVFTHRMKWLMMYTLYLHAKRP